MRRVNRFSTLLKHRIKEIENASPDRRKFLARHHLEQFTSSMLEPLLEELANPEKDTTAVGISCVDFVKHASTRLTPAFLANGDPELMHSYDKWAWNFAITMEGLNSDLDFDLVARRAIVCAITPGLLAQLLELTDKTLISEKSRELAEM